MVRAENDGDLPAMREIILRDEDNNVVFLQFSGMTREQAMSRLNTILVAAGGTLRGRVL
jgi:hypothetical protein